MLMKSKGEEFYHLQVKDISNGLCILLLCFTQSKKFKDKILDKGGMEKESSCNYLINIY